MTSSLIDTVILLPVHYALNNDMVGFCNTLCPKTVIEIWCSKSYTDDVLLLFKSLMLKTYLFEFSMRL